MKTLEIYTDGACSGNPGPGGYGIVMLYKEERREISCGYKCTTNNRMELMAVLHGLKALKEQCKVDLYLDSKYIVDAINKGWAAKWKKNNWMRNKSEPALNADLWEELFVLLDMHKVNFIWIKGHNNNLENERCDVLARQAIKEKKLLDDTNYIKISKKY